MPNPNKKKNKNSSLKKNQKSRNNEIVIYGIFDLKKKKLVKVDLDEENIGFEFDIGLYDARKYSVVKLYFSI